MVTMARSEDIEICIKNCLECYQACLETKVYCLEKGSTHAEVMHIGKLSDCLELCEISAHFMIKGSDLYPKVCAVCAEACKICAESCEEFADDREMEKCAEVCRRCQKSCETIAEIV